LHMETKVKIRKSTSIDVAISILELFSAEKKELGILDMAKTLGKNVSTLHRTVTILKQRGYVEQSAGRSKYRLGLKVFELGCVYQNQSNVIKDAMDRVERLANATNETVNLAVLDQELREIAYIAKIESTQVLKTDIQIGTKLLAHCTALGKVLLAHLDQSVIERLFPPHASLPVYTKKSIASTDKLRKVLTEVRNNGFALDLDEFREGVVCVARPFRDMNNKVVAAISVTAPSFRCSADRIEEINQTMLGILGS